MRRDLRRCGAQLGVALAHKKWSTFQRIFQPSFNSNSYQHPFAILILLQCGRRGCTLVSFQKTGWKSQNNLFSFNDWARLTLILFVFFLLVKIFFYLSVNFTCNTFSRLPIFFCFFQDMSKRNKTYSNPDEILFVIQPCVHPCWSSLYILEHNVNNASKKSHRISFNNWMSEKCKQRGANFGCLLLWFTFPNSNSFVG